MPDPANKKIRLEWQVATSGILGCAEYFLGTLHPALMVAPKLVIEQTLDMWKNLLAPGLSPSLKKKHHVLCAVDFIDTWPKPVSLHYLVYWQHLIQDLEEINRYLHSEDCLTAPQEWFWFLLPALSVLTLPATYHECQKAPVPVYRNLCQLYGSLGYGQRTYSSRNTRLQIQDLYLSIFDSSLSVPEMGTWLHQVSVFLLWVKALSLGSPERTGRYRYHCNQALKHWDYKKDPTL